MHSRDTKDKLPSISVDQKLEPILTLLRRRDRVNFADYAKHRKEVLGFKPLNTLEELRFLTVGYFCYQYDMSPELYGDNESLLMTYLHSN